MLSGQYTVFTSVPFELYFYRNTTNKLHTYLEKQSSRDVLPPFVSVVILKNCIHNDMAHIHFI